MPIGDLSQKTQDKYQASQAAIQSLLDATKDITTVTSFSGDQESIHIDEQTIVSLLIKLESGAHSSEQTPSEKVALREIKFAQAFAQTPLQKQHGNALVDLVKTAQTVAKEAPLIKPRTATEAVTQVMPQSQDGQWVEMIDHHQDLDWFQSRLLEKGQSQDQANARIAELRQSLVQIATGEGTQSDLDYIQKEKQFFHSRMAHNTGTSKGSYERLTGLIEGVESIASQDKSALNKRFMTHVNYHLSMCKSHEGLPDTIQNISTNMVKFLDTVTPFMDQQSQEYASATQLKAIASDPNVSENMLSEALTEVKSNAQASNRRHHM